MSPDDGGGPSGASLSNRHILEREMERALREIDRPSRGVFLSGLAAGLDLSFGALFMAMALTFSGGFASKLIQQAVLGAASSVAFLFVVVGGTELFTAHTTMAVLPVLDGRASARDLGRLWGLTYASNLLGCATFAVLIATLGPAMGIVTPAALRTLSSSLLRLPWWATAASGVVAGWLMGLATWLSAASRDTVGRIVFVLVVTAAIGAGPFHHVVLGTTELLSAAFLGLPVGPAGYGSFLVWTTLGNVVGGSVFVGLLNYGHLEWAGEPHDVEFEPADGDR